MSPIYVAIDTPDLARAKAIATRTRTHVGGIKLGLEFFCAHGQHGVHEMAKLGLPIFLDLKLHDIPNTVAKAIQALGPLEPAILTVHASGGRAMLEDAKAAAPLNTKVVAVTMLTSLDADDLTATGITGSAHDQVLRLTDLAHEAGIDGIVCSGEEVRAAKTAWPKGFFVVPRRPSRQWQRRRPEARRHSPRRARCGRLYSRHRPPDHPGRRPRRRRPRDRRDALAARGADRSAATASQPRHCECSEAIQGFLVRL